MPKKGSCAVPHPGTRQRVSVLTVGCSQPAQRRVQRPTPRRAFRLGKKQPQEIPWGAGGGKQLCLLRAGAQVPWRLTGLYAHAHTCRCRPWWGSAPRGAVAASCIPGRSRGGDAGVGQAGALPSRGTGWEGGPDLPQDPPCCGGHPGLSRHRGNLGLWFPHPRTRPLQAVSPSQCHQRRDRAISHCSSPHF